MLEAETTVFIKYGGLAPGLGIHVECHCGVLVWGGGHVAWAFVGWVELLYAGKGGGPWQLLVRQLVWLLLSLDSRMPFILYVLTPHT